jgi:type IV pilus assembly protein PilA
MYVASGQPSGKATASLICGIFFFIFPLPVIAVILGHMALSEIKKSAGRLIGEGRAIAGLVLGYFGLLAALPILLIIAAIAIPNLIRSHQAGNEASAVGGIRAINIAEVTYANNYPKVGYACELYQLCGDAQHATSTGAGLLENTLSSGTKDGYRFRVMTCSEDNGVFNHYQIAATPLQPGSTGTRTFCTDETGVINFISSGSARDCLDNGTPIR